MRAAVRLILEACLGMTLLGFVSRVRAALETLSRSSPASASVAAAGRREMADF